MDDKPKNDQSKKIIIADSIIHNPIGSGLKLHGIGNKQVIISNIVVIGAGGNGLDICGHRRDEITELLWAVNMEAMRLLPNIPEKDEINRQHNDLRREYTDKNNWTLTDGLKELFIQFCLFAKAVGEKHQVDSLVIICKETERQFQGLNRS